MTGQIMDEYQSSVRQYLWPGASVLTPDTEPSISVTSNDFSIM